MHRELRSLGLCVLLLVSYAVLVAAVGNYQKTVELGWTVVPAEGIEVFPDALMFGDIEQGKNATSSFIVTNVAGVVLNVSVAPTILTFSGYEIVIDPDVFILDVGQTQTVTVTIVVSEITEPGTYTNALKVEAWVV